MSNRTLTIVLVVLIVIAAAFGVFWFIGSRSGAGSASTGTSNANPFGNLGTGSSGQQPNGSTTTSGAGELPVIAKNGSTVDVPDFRSGHQTAQEGSLTSYYLTDNQQAQGASAQFDITYNSDSSILITLLAEPLGASRTAGEAALRTYFPLSDTQLCALNVTVATIYSVNPQYAGENLGLSFCPNSVPLP